MSNPSIPVNPAPAPPQPPPPPPPTSCTLIVVSAIVGLTLMGLLIFWLVWNPNLPTFHLSSLSLSNFSTSQSQVTGNWDAQFQVYNPSNKMTIYFHRVVSTLSYKSDYLSKTNISPFEVDTKNFTTVHARFSLLGSYFDKRVMDSISGERSRGSVRFNFGLYCLVGSSKNSMWYLTLYCDDVAVNVTACSGGWGMLVGGPRKCKHFL